MKITRRDALKKTSKNLGLTFIPSYLATGARAEGDPQPPSKRINLGCVGVGGRVGPLMTESLINRRYIMGCPFKSVSFSRKYSGTPITFKKR